jgi:hypothetical protein
MPLSDPSAPPNAIIALGIWRSMLVTAPVASPPKRANCQPARRSIVVPRRCAARMAAPNSRPLAVPIRPPHAARYPKPPPAQVDQSIRARYASSRCCRYPPATRTASAKPTATTVHGIDQSKARPSNPRNRRSITLSSSQREPQVAHAPRLLPNAFRYTGVEQQRAGRIVREPHSLVKERVPPPRMAPAPLSVIGCEDPKVASVPPRPRSRRGQRRRSGTPAIAHAPATGVRAGATPDKHLRLNRLNLG